MGGLAAKQASSWGIAFPPCWGAKDAQELSSRAASSPPSLAKYCTLALAYYCTVRAHSRIDIDYGTMHQDAHSEMGGWGLGPGRSGIRIVGVRIVVFDRGVENRMCNDSLSPSGATQHTHTCSQCMGVRSYFVPHSRVRRPAGRRREMPGEMQFETNSLHTG